MARDLADLLRPRHLDDRSDPQPLLMSGTVIDLDPLLVTIPSLDAGANAHSPTNDPDVLVGDTVWLMADEQGELVIVAT